MNFKELVENFKESIGDPDLVDKTGFEVHGELNPKFWLVRDILTPKITKRLIEIVNEFWEGLELKNVKIKDITMTGSLANYNWSNHSDIDVHIIVDFDELDKDTDLVSDYFNAKKSIWNQRHDIRIFGYEVEVYVQNDNEPHHSTGVYSIINNKWIVRPKREEATIDWQNVQDKAASLMDQIDRVGDLFIEGKHREAYDYGLKLKEKIRKFRRTGLETIGQYSSENIAFKVLRRNGYLERLAGLRVSAYDAMKSIKDEPIKITVKESCNIWHNFLESEEK
tara:strand:- start:174 stop:1013 length:840 start_codon:yes stop_codon:yes gene_type:complete